MPATRHHLIDALLNSDGPELLATDEGTMNHTLYEITQMRRDDLLRAAAKRRLGTRPVPIRRWRSERESRPSTAKASAAVATFAHRPDAYQSNIREDTRCKASI
jgi:hypothetical protein